MDHSRTRSTTTAKHPIDREFKIALATFALTPEMMAAFDVTEPGMAARVLGHAQAEAEHRWQMERATLDLQKQKLGFEYNLATRGQWLSVVTAVTLVAATVYAAGRGLGNPMGVLAAGGIGGAVGGFLRSRPLGWPKRMDPVESAATAAQ